MLIQKKKLSEQACTSTKQLRVILDTKYEKADLNNVTEENSNISQKQNVMNCQNCYKLLKSCSMEHLAPEKKPVELELKEDVKPICLRPYPVPKVHIFQKEVERLVLLVVLHLHNLSLNKIDHAF